MATVTEEDVLHMIWEQAPYTEFDAHDHGFDKYIDTLIEKGLVIRIPSSAGTHIYALTGKGEKHIDIDE